MALGLVYFAIPGINLLLRLIFAPDAGVTNAGAGTDRREGTTSLTRSWHIAVT